MENKFFFFFFFDVADRIRFRLCVQVYKCQHSMAPGYLAELCRDSCRQHRRSPASAICWSLPSRCSASQTVSIRRTRVLLCRTFSLERSLPDFFKKKIHFLSLLFDTSLNISTSHFTSTPNVFEVILQLTRNTNYLLTS